MDAIGLRTRLRRLGYMLSEKGVRYTWNFIFMASMYNNDFVRYLLLTKLYKWFVFYPRYFEVEVTTRCHLKCVMCEHTYWKERPIDLGLDEFKRIIGQFPKLSWIGTTGIGSSFLNKDFPEMLRYLKGRDKNIYVELFDSFSGLTGDIIEDVVREGLIDRWIVSMDGATKETYEKIRVGASFERVIGNIRHLIDTKEKYGTNFPEFSFHFVVTKDNYAEVPEFVELVAKLSRGRNIGILFSQLLHGFREVEGLAFELPEEPRACAVRLAKKHGIKLSWGKNIKEKDPISRCTEWTMPFVFADGSVVQCCASNEANKRQFQIEHGMGNILKEDFGSIWTGPVFRGLRDAIHNGKVPLQCANCPIYERG